MPMRPGIAMPPATMNNMMMNNMMMNNMMMNNVNVARVRVFPNVHRNLPFWWWNSRYYNPYGYYSPYVMYSGGMYAGLGYGSAYAGNYGYSNGNSGSYVRSSREYPETPATEYHRPTDRELLERVRDRPTAAEVASGKALNDVLADLQRAAAEVGPDRLPVVNLDLGPEELTHINVSRGAGNIALLKHDGALAWPAALAGPAFDDPRSRLTTAAKEAVRQAKATGRVDDGITHAMAADVAAMQEQMRGAVRSLSMDSYLAARTFLVNLADAVTALQQPDIGRHFTGAYALTAVTVPELAKFMSEKGLKFAPALPGDEATYAALQRALAAADRAVTAKAAAKPAEDSGRTAAYYIP
jgi:hypothetical protein